VTLAEAVQIDIDPTTVLAWIAAAFFAVISWLVQREWSRHEKAHETLDARLTAVEKRVHPREEDE